MTRTLTQRIHEELGLDLTQNGVKSFIKANFGDLRTLVAQEMAEEWLLARVTERRKINSERKAEQRNYKAQVESQVKGVELLKMLGGSYEYVGSCGFIVNFSYTGDVCVFGTYQYMTLREALREAFMKALDTRGFREDVGLEVVNSICRYLGALHMVVDIDDAGVNEPNETTTPASTDDVHPDFPKTVQEFESCFDKELFMLVVEDYRVEFYKNGDVYNYRIHGLDICSTGCTSSRGAYIEAYDYILKHLNIPKHKALNLMRRRYPDSLKYALQIS